MSVKDSSATIGFEDVGEMPNDKPQKMNHSFSKLTFEILPSKFSFLLSDLYYSTLIPGSLWFSVKNEPVGKFRTVSELEIALAA